MKRCSICKKDRDLIEFNKNKRKSDGLQSKCRACGKKLAQSYYQKNKDYFKRRKNKYAKRNQAIVLDYLRQHPCVDCGESDPVVLEFDHIRDKISEISTLVWKRVSAKMLLEEIEKCLVRCANCHRRKTANDFEYYKAIRQTV